MAFVLPELPYELDALEPHISKNTLEFHYGKHHQAYVNNLNTLIKDTMYEYSDLEEIIKRADDGIFNNGAQVYNHTFYFEALSPNGGGEPTGLLASKIKEKYGSIDSFIDEFSGFAKRFFGSGWVWLVKNKEEELEIVTTSNAGNPIRDGLTPLMCLDVWEHAYYLDVQNARPKYIENFWNVLNWVVVAERY